MVTEDEKIELERVFTKDEIKGAIFESYPEGAPGLDGLSIIFIKILGGCQG
jgi:hypothetical protein